VLRGAPALRNHWVQQSGDADALTFGSCSKRVPEAIAALSLKRPVGKVFVLDVSPPERYGRKRLKRETAALAAEIHEYVKQHPSRLASTSAEHFEMVQAMEGAESEEESREDARYGIVSATFLGTIAAALLARAVAHETEQRHAAVEAAAALSQTILRSARSA